MQFGVSESVRHWGQYRPASSAIVHNEQVSTYGELNAAVDALCGEIITLQCASDRIAVAIRSRFRLLVAIIAVLRSGNSVVLLNSDLDEDALRVNLRESEVSLLIHDNENEKIEKLIDTSARKKTLNIDELRKGAQPKATNPLPSEPHDEWGVLFSSGTTGVPKGIERNQDSIVTEFVGWCLELALNRRTRFYVGRPIYYTGGLVLTCSTLLVGGELVLNDYDDHNSPKQVWSDYQGTLSSGSIDWAFFVPGQIRAFCEIVAAEGSTPLSADNILVMGAPITGEEKTKASRLLSSDIIESWGNTESLGTITDAEDLEKRPNSIGRPFLTDELYIVDDNLQIMGPNQQGRIAGNEEAGFSKYSNRPDDTNRAKQNSLIISEDIGYTDKDGFFYVLGRQQDRIMVGEDTVFLPEIEAQLRKHVLIKDCCVRPKDPSEVNVEFVAVIVPSQALEVNEQDLLKQLNVLLPVSQQLADILFLDEMPYLQAGKIDKLKLDSIVKDRL